MNRDQAEHIFKVLCCKETHEKKYHEISEDVDFLLKRYDEVKREKSKRNAYKIAVVDWLVSKYVSFV